MAFSKRTNFVLFVHVSQPDPDRSDRSDRCMAQWRRAVIRCSVSGVMVWEADLSPYGEPLWRWDKEWNFPNMCHMFFPHLFLSFWFHFGFCIVPMVAECSSLKHSYLCSLNFLWSFFLSLKSSARKKDLRCFLAAKVSRIRRKQQQLPGPGSEAIRSCSVGSSMVLALYGCSLFFFLRGVSVNLRMELVEENSSQESQERLKDTEAWFAKNFCLITFFQVVSEQFQVGPLFLQPLSFLLRRKPFQPVAAVLFLPQGTVWVHQSELVINSQHCRPLMCVGIGWSDRKSVV